MRIPIVIALAAALLAGLGLIASRGESAESASCRATVTRYEWNKRAGGAPWISAGVGRSRLEAYLYSYHQYLGDGRVNRAEVAVLRAGRPEKIAWFSTTWGGSRLTVTGRRLDGRGTFSQRFRATPGAGFYPSGIRIPTPGCWQLTLRTQGWLHRVVVKAVTQAPASTCDATPVGEDGSLALTPARSGLTASWPSRTPEGGAQLYAGGRTPDGGYTKVLWRSKRSGGLLVVRGTRLDAQGTFRQSFDEAQSPRGFWPSIVVVPDLGCWLLTMRIGGQPGAAGILVARVV